MNTRASAPAKAEREVIPLHVIFLDHRCSSRGIVAQETVRLKLAWVFVPLRVSMERSQVRKHYRCLWDEASAVYKILGRVVRDACEREF